MRRERKNRAAPVGMTSLVKARRATIRRGRESRAAPVGMTGLGRTRQRVETLSKEEEWWRLVVRAHPHKTRVGHPQVHWVSGVCGKTQEHSQKCVTGQKSRSLALRGGLGMTSLWLGGRRESGGKPPHSKGNPRALSLRGSGQARVTVPHGKGARFGKRPLQRPEKPRAQVSA